MPIQRLLQAAAPDADTTMVAASAFETAWNILRKSGSTLAAADKSIVARQLLAEQIIALGRAGERDQERLVRGALVHVASCETISRGVGRLRANANTGDRIKPQ